jgi:uncharacterized protein (TIGR03067 family)
MNVHSRECEPASALQVLEHEFLEVRMRSRKLMFAAVGVAGMAAGSQHVARARDFARLQGNWTAVKAERDGREDQDIVGHLLLVEGHQFRIQENGATIYEGTLALDMSASPAAIDFTHSGDWSHGKRWRGICRIEGDTLTICDNAGNMENHRPTSFDTEPSSGRVLVVFKRAPQ